MTDRLTLAVASRMIRDAVKDRSYRATPLGLEVARYYRWAEWCEGRNPSRKESYSERLARDGGMAASGKFREASNPASEPEAS